MYEYIHEFRDSALGMAVHWGLYSQVGEGEWSRHMKPMGLEEYGELAKTFTAEDFDARGWAKLAKRAGMKFIMLTTRHHDGFSLYDTKGLNEFDAPHSAAGRDLIAEFVEGCRAEGISPFFYHTTMDWWWKGKKTWNITKEEFDEYLDYLNASVEILCKNYGEIGGFIFDGHWCRPDMDWKDSRLYGMIRSLQPNAIIMNNTGLASNGVLTHEEIDAVTFEQYEVKSVSFDREKPVASMRWQTTNMHWGVGKRDLCFKSPAEIIEGFCDTRRHGAVNVINIGPEAQGAVQPMDRCLLELLGVWMDCYAEAVRGTTPSKAVCHDKDYILENEKHGYYLCYNLGITGHEDVTQLDTTEGPRGIQGLKKKIKKIEWMDNGEELQFTQNGDLAVFEATGFAYGENMAVRVARIHFED